MPLRSHAAADVDGAGRGTYGFDGAARSTMVGQTYYFDDGLLRRLDYAVDILGTAFS